MDISFKDDVTVILLLGASFMVARAYKYFVLGLFAVDIWLYSESLACCLVNTAKRI